MKSQALAAVLSLGLLAQGCAITPTDMTPVQGGATRQQVEKVLGSPIKSVKTAAGRTDTYAYDRGAPAAYLPSARGYGVAALGLPVLVLIAHAIEYGRQRGEIHITYGPDGRVIRTSAPWLTKQQPANLLKQAKRRAAAVVVSRAQSRTLSEKGLNLFKLGQFKNAMVVLDSAIRLDPTNACAYYIRGITYYRLKKYGRAIQDYNNALRHNPRYDFAYNARGVAYQRLGFRQNALRDYRKALAIDPNNKKARQNIRTLEFNSLSKKMTPAQIAEAKPRAKDWKPGQCEVKAATRARVGG